jgi:SNF2 family DNA or RNA helicase
MKLKERYQSKFGLLPEVLLRGYQLKGVKVGTSNDCVALLMDPRLGKTRTDIAITGYRYLNNGIKRWVIVCPSIAKQVWIDEIKQTLSIPYKIEMVEGKAEERRLLLKEWKDEPGTLSILVINFEATWRIKKVLYKFNPDKITVDESHRIKSSSAKQSRTLHTLSRRATYRSILTGTFMSTPLDVFSQYKFLDPTIFGDKKSSFLSRYVDKYGYGGYKPKTFKNLEELYNKYSPIAFHLRRSDAKGFPREMVQNVTFPLTGKSQNHYQEMEVELKTLVQNTEVRASIVLTQLLRLQQITGGFLPVLKDNEDKPVNTSIGSDKLKALSELINEYDPDTSLVIFAKYRYEISSILKQVKTRKPGSITGGMKQDERSQVIRDFQSGKIKTCVIQIRAGGIAVNLDQANTAIFYSLTHSFVDYEQAKARIIGKGKSSVVFIHLCASGTVDQDICEAINLKQDLVNLVMKKL